MPTPRNEPSRPVADQQSGGFMPQWPDPTALTTQGQDRLEQNLRREFGNTRELFDLLLNAIKEQISRSHAIVETRLDGNDTAIELLQDQSSEFPNRVDEKIDALRSVHNEMFASIQKQFVERDQRTTTVAELNQKAIDAALAAAKEMVNKQQEGTDKATARVEGSMKEQMAAMALLLQTSREASDDKFGDLKERMTRLEGRDEGGNARVARQQASVGTIGVVIGALVAVGGLAIALFLHK